MWPRSQRHGIDFSPALGAAPDTTTTSNNHAYKTKPGKPTGAGGDDDAAAGGGVGGGTSGETGETLHTTIASGNGREGADPNRNSPSMSIMELFDAPSSMNIVNGGGTGTGTGAGGGRRPAAAAPSAEATPRGAARRYAGSAVATPASTSRAWKLANGQSKTAPPSTSTAGSGSAERHGYLSFSEVQVEDDDADLSGGFPHHHHRSSGSSASSSLSGMYSGQRELPPSKRKKRARAWKLFVAVMQEHGLRVRKYHRHGKGWAHRVVTYDPALPGLRWKTSKWWGSGGGQVPLRDVLDVERKGKVVWIKCLHLGTIGFEASLETDAVIFYLAMDSLLDTRCGVGGDDAAARFFGVPEA